MVEISFKYFNPARRLPVILPRSLPSCINGHVQYMSVTWVRAAFFFFFYCIMTSLLMHTDKLRWVNMFFQNIDGRVPFLQLYFNCTKHVECKVWQERGFKYSILKIEPFLKMALWVLKELFVAALWIFFQMHICLYCCKSTKYFLSVGMTFFFNLENVIGTELVTEWFSVQ